ncbi:MAG: hypothetical protein JWQ89_2627 [Devosia sp.]|uniref:hypothetical protein n=1 Tax=Devosia sp. TaxID=1871048 RepID=UPI00260C3A65|nr:hypothetical protein [Devosia sp.]MDB5540900.1 hypothetical protein [Devosia sp.]
MSIAFILDLAKRFWWAPVIAGLMIALLLTRATNALHREQLATCNAKQAVNLSTIDGLLGNLADQNAKVDALADAGAAKQKAAKDALAGAIEREKAAQVTSDRLRASAAVIRAEGAPCVISDALAGARGL